VRVLVDTNVWSLALRRRPEQRSAGDSRLVAAWEELVAEGRAILTGIVRQEVLSGVPDEKRFGQLRDVLATFPDEPLLPADHVRAAEMYNQCRTRGVQCTSIDILLCAVAERLAAPIFTTDDDFEQYARHIPVELFQTRA
jgi:predicted nucleic acid-binding protein